MNLRLRIPLLMSLAFCVASNVHAQGQAITRDSPFGGNAAAPAAAPTENAPLELRGIVATTRGYLYGIFDPTKRLSSWVGLNDSSADFVVRAHDETADTITVEYQGRSMTLGLKAAKVESLGPAPVPMQPGPRPNANPPVALNPSPADEARRLEGVAAEVRRRRMLRQQAAQQAAAQAQGVPQPQQR